MPPHLHPRSRATSGLFAATIVASFFVVGVPHVLPCPAPRVALADGESGRKRRRRAGENIEVHDGMVQFGNVEDSNAPESVRERRECPVPKPGGILGEMLGFHATKKVMRTEDKQHTQSRRRENDS